MPNTIAAPSWKAPFPYFGGKSRAADLVWKRFGAVRNYVEPFFGSGAVLLARPTPFEGSETINDADGMLANFRRATQADPDAVAHHADWPMNENDLHARHAWLVARKDSLQARLEGDPDYFDAKIAGWWCWGLCAWIGNGWCSGRGPWRAIDGELCRVGDDEVAGVKRQRPYLNSGMGINRQRPNLGDAGKGVHRAIATATCADQAEHLRGYFRTLSDRLRRVRVCCGDWSRVCGHTPTLGQPGITAVFLDPPYSAAANRDDRVYATDSFTVANDAREWAIKQGDNPRIRIALCGYESEHAMPGTWECVPWKANGGYGSQSKQHDNPNARRERIWFSPHCLKPPESGGKPRGRRVKP